MIKINYSSSSTVVPVFRKVHLLFQSSSSSRTGTGIKNAGTGIILIPVLRAGTTLASSYLFILAIVYDGSFHWIASYF